jgi:hypothetical protein
MSTKEVDFSSGYLKKIDRLCVFLFTKEKYVINAIGSD